MPLGPARMVPLIMPAQAVKLLLMKSAPVVANTMSTEI